MTLTDTIPVAGRSKAWACGRSLAGIAGSNSVGWLGYLSLVSVVCCLVEVSASCWSLVQRIPAECGVSETNREAWALRGPWPTRERLARRKKISSTYQDTYVYWTVHHLDSWIMRDQLDATCFIISLFNAQRVPDVNTSETCWALNNETIKQVASSWYLFIQLPRYVYVHFQYFWCLVWKCNAWCRRSSSQLVKLNASTYIRT